MYISRQRPCEIEAHYVAAATPRRSLYEPESSESPPKREAHPLTLLLHAIPTDASVPRQNLLNSHSYRIQPTKLRLSGGAMEAASARMAARDRYGAFGEAPSSPLQRFICKHRTAWLHTRY